MKLIPVFLQATQQAASSETYGAVLLFLLLLFLPFLIAILIAKDEEESAIYRPGTFRSTTFNSRPNNSRSNPPTQDSVYRESVSVRYAPREAFFTGKLPSNDQQQNPKITKVRKRRR